MYVYCMYAVPLEAIRGYQSPLKLEEQMVVSCHGCLEPNLMLGVVALAFNPSTQEGNKNRWIS